MPDKVMEIGENYLCDYDETKESLYDVEESDSEYSYEPEELDDKEIEEIEKETLDEEGLSEEQSQTKNKDLLYGKKYTPEEWKQILDNYESEDMQLHEQAGEIIYKAMFPFLKRLATKCYSTYFPKYGEDLMEAAFLGLFGAISSYDPNKGKPTTWFSRTALHEMRDFIDREVHHTTPHYQIHLQEIKKYINEYNARGIQYTVDDIAIATGFPKPTIANCIALYQRNQNSVSLEQPAGDNNISIGDTLTTSVQGPEDYVLERERNEHLYTLMRNRLTPQELSVLKLAHGFVDDDPKSMTDIANILNMKKQDVRPVSNMAEQKLRSAMKYNDIFNENANGKKPWQTVQFIKSNEELLREIDSIDFDNLDI